MTNEPSADVTAPIDLPPDTPEVFIEAEDPKRRGKGMLVGVCAAVLVVAAVVVGIVVATSGDSEAKYSVAAAAKSAADAHAVAFEQTLTVNGVDATSEGRMDTQTHLMALTMQIPSLSAEPIGMVFDVSNTTMYMQAAPFVDAGAPVDTDWVSIDLSAVPGLEEVFGSAANSNPLDVAKQFAAAKTVKEVGMEEVAGVKAKHYLVTVVTKDALAKFPELADFIDKAGITTEDEIVYDVWVDESNQLRRSKYTTTINGQEQSQDIVYTAIGEIDPIEVPADDQVTDLTKLLGG